MYELCRNNKKKPWVLNDPLDNSINHCQPISTTLKSPALSVITNYVKKLKNL